MLTRVPSALTFCSGFKELTQRRTGGNMQRQNSKGWACRVEGGGRLEEEYDV